MNHNFRNIQAWQRSVELAVRVIKTTEKFPTEHRFGLSSQINSSGVSIPSNIAEGSGRRTEKDFSKFLDIAIGSSLELETQLIIAKQAGILEKETHD